MDKDYGKDSGEALAHANAITEITIFWCMIIAAVVIVIAMLKGVLMLG